MSVALARWRPRALPAGVAAVVGAGCIGLVVLGFGLAVVTEQGLGRLAGEFALGNAIVAATFATVGATVAARRPGHGVGLLLLGTGVVAATSFTSTRYAVYAYGPAQAPLGPAAGWLASWVWFLYYPLLVLLLLVFPTGRALGRGWRVLGWVAALHGLVGAALLATSEQTVAAGLPVEYRNPLAVDGIAFDQWVLDVVLVSLLLTAAAVVVRFRRADSRERRQLGWFCYAAVLAVLAYLAAVQLDAAPLGFSVGWPLVAVAAGVTVLRQRLYGVDVAVSRSLVGAVLVLFFSAGWVVAATVVGAIVGRDRSDLLPAMAATAVVVMAAEPVRRATARWADRVVRGRRAEPYRVLAAFAQQAGTAGPDDLLLAETARLVVAALGARDATVWLREGKELRAAASHPEPRGRTVVGLTSGTFPLNLILGWFACLR